MDSIFWTKSFESYVKEKSPAWCSQEIPREVSFFSFKSSSVLLLCKYIFLLHRQAGMLTHKPCRDKVEQTVKKKSNQTTNGWNVTLDVEKKQKGVNLKVIVVFNQEKQLTG